MSGRTLAAVIGVGVALAAPPLWSATQVLTGAAAFGDWHQDAPGVSRKITAADLPAPFATPSSRETAHIVSEPSGATPHVPPGFTVTRIADHLENPRAMTVAPNGDVFIAESRADQIVVLRGGQVSTFATGLDSPYGIAFYPPGPEPKFVYVGNTQSIVRFPYKNGDLKAGGQPETLVAPLSDSGSGHWTRDIAFSPDGKRMYVSVGSSTNDAENRPNQPPEPAWEAEHGLGAGWAHETNRADLLEFSAGGREGAGVRGGVAQLRRSRG